MRRTGVPRVIGRSWASDAKLVAIRRLLAARANGSAVRLTLASPPMGNVLSSRRTTSSIYGTCKIYLKSRPAKASRDYGSGNAGYEKQVDRWSHNLPNE